MQSHFRDRQSVARFFGSKMLVVALNASTGILTARALHVAGRGELAAIRLWPMLLSGCLTLGVPSALTFHIRRSPECRSALIEGAVLISVFVGTCGSAIGIHYAATLLSNYPPAIVLLVRCLMPLLIIGLLLPVGRAVLEAESKFARSGLILVLPPSFALLGLLLLRSLHQLSPTNAGLIYALADVPTLAVLWLSLRFSFRSSFREITHSITRLFSYGMRVYGVDLCGAVSFYIDQAVVVKLLSPSAMGYYAVSLSLSRITSVPHQALATMLFPTLIDVNKKTIPQVLDQTLRTSGTFAIVSSLLALAGGRFLLRGLYGKAFAQDAWILPILTLEAGLSGCVLILAQAFMAIDRPFSVTVQQVVGLTAAISLLLILVPPLGVRGAALAILGSTLLRLFMISTSYRLVFGSYPSFRINHESCSWLKRQVMSIVSAHGDLA